MLVHVLNIKVLIVANIAQEMSFKGLYLFKCLQQLEY